MRELMVGVVIGFFIGCFAGSADERRASAKALNAAMSSHRDDLQSCVETVQKGNAALKACLR